MGKITWKPGTFVYPIPAVIESHIKAIESICKNNTVL